MMISLLAIAGIFTLYLRQAVPEVKDILLLWVGLIAVGMLLGI